MSASTSSRSLVNSVSGNTGSRRMSVTMSSAAARFSRVETTRTLTTWPLPAIATVDFSASSASLICCSVRFFVPRRSIAAVSCATVALPRSDASLPKCSVIEASTALPRVDLARTL